MAKLLPNAAELCRKAFFFSFFSERKGAEGAGHGAGGARDARAQGKALRAPLDFATRKVYNI